MVAWPEAPEWAGCDPPYGNLARGLAWADESSSTTSHRGTRRLRVCRQPRGKYDYQIAHTTNRSPHGCGVDGAWVCQCGGQCVHLDHRGWGCSGGYGDVDGAY